MNDRPKSPEAPALLADQMLGAAAKRLRLLGYDCDLAQAGDPTGEALVEKARGQGRMLLTGAQRLAQAHPDEVLALPTEDVDGQVGAVATAWPLDFEKTAFTRCSLCNIPVEEVDREAVAEQLPPKVRQRNPKVKRCPNCGKLYWEGSHVARLKESFRKLMHPPGKPENP